MPESDSIPQTDEEWREVLSDEEYQILREKGTEPRFSGEHISTNEEGTYQCAACGVELFDSETKFGTNTGWPSFYDAMEDAIELHRDTSHGMNRTEVVCARCGGHLGHVFDDGPDPTGKRYCINSVSLDFETEEE
ncbi:peptide-methionine (R)-S-oxide reductase MsrB [Halocatena marina]|uniref:peptide-methionine (R)-S-oxide reductase n=1 Tax=Halocatena marina TaxID=2934937 RepID=A0ABD5YPL2_9EURY|nr:peptide-methionine (R)-S-oxide reductase MsrB [Halocatena marina]